MKPVYATGVLALLCMLPGCGADMPSKSQAASILLKSLQAQCDVSTQQFFRNYGYPYDRFSAFFTNVILAHPERFQRQGAKDGTAEFGGTFTETDEPMPLRFTIESYFPGPWERGIISYCPWYTKSVQIFDMTRVAPKEVKVTYGQTKVMTKLAADLLSAGVISQAPQANVPMREVLFRRYDSLGWRLEDQSGD